MTAEKSRDRPELHDDVIRGTYNVDGDQLLKVTEPVCIETDLQRLESIDLYSPSRRLNINEPVERCVGPLDLERGWNKAAVRQHHLVPVRRLGEDCASVQSVERQLKVWRKTVGTDRQRQPSLSTSHVTEHQLHTATSTCWNMEQW